LPDELIVFRAGQSEGSRDFRQNLDRLRLFMKLTVIPPIVFLLAITILAVRSLGDWLKWWGFPFLITGILGLLTALLAAPLVPPIVEFLFSQSGPDIPAIFVELVRNTAGSLAGEILRPVAILGTAIASIGAVMVTMNWILKRQN
jgi:hypothetical protein